MIPRTWAPSERMSILSAVDALILVSGWAIINLGVGFGVPRGVAVILRVVIPFVLGERGQSQAGAVIVNPVSLAIVTATAVTITVATTTAVITITPATVVVIAATAIAMPSAIYLGSPVRVNLVVRMYAMSPLCRATRRRVFNAVPTVDKLR